MEIGILGAGDFAQAFSKQALKAGHKVKLSHSRGPDSLREIVDELGPGAIAATKEEAAACEMVLLAALAPEARVVKALNNMTVANLEADPVVNGARRVAFISADDDDAKRRVGTVLKAFGYSVIDLGNLRDGGLIQQAGGPLAGRDLLERGEYPE
jgi:hypothetical protein